ncbi:MAG: PEP-CTERM sorting domain-containing protein [Desulfomonilia bacterium]
MKKMCFFILFFCINITLSLDIYGSSITFQTLEQEVRVDNGVTPNILGPFLDGSGYSCAQIGGYVRLYDDSTAWLSATSSINIITDKSVNADNITTNTLFNFAGWSNGFEMNHTFKGTYKLSLLSDYDYDIPVLVTTYFGSLGYYYFSSLIYDDSNNVIFEINSYSSQSSVSFYLLPGDSYYFDFYVYEDNFGSTFNNSLSIITVEPAPVPEPSTILLLGTSIFGLGAIRKVFFGTIES